MTTVSTIIDDQLLKEFRSIIYGKYGLKKGDFKKALKEAIGDYINKYGGSAQGKSLEKEVAGAPS